METANTIYINRKFNCPKLELFEWLTKPQLIAQWFGPKRLSVGHVQTDLKIGGEYRIELLKADGQHFFILGAYQKISRPDQLVFSFKYEGLSSAPPESLVKITIEEITPKQSHLYLMQEFKTIPTDMESRTAAWNAMFSELENKFKK